MVKNGGYMKRFLIVVFALLCANEAFPRYYRGHYHRGSGFGGGFLAGAATTGIIAATASSGRHKSDAYYESQEKSRQRNEIRKQIAKHKKAIKQNQRAITRLEKRLEKLYKKPSYSKSQAQQHKDKIQKHHDKITHHEGLIEELEEELRDIF